MSLCDEKCCFATRRVTSSREALFKTFEKCDFVTISVALRREVLLRNEKSDSVTISVVTSLDHSVGSADSSRRFHLLFSTDLVRHFPRHDPAALLKCFAPFRRLRRHFSTVSPSLLAGYTCSSRWLCQHFSTDLVRHFSPVSPALLKCFVPFRRLRRLFSTVSPSLLAGFTGTSQMIIAFFT